MGASAVDALRDCWSHADMSPSDAFDRPWSPERSQRPYFGLFRLDGEVADEVVVYWRLPNAFEIDCHGGDQASARILDALVLRGAGIVDGVEWEACARRAERRFFPEESSDADGYQPSESVQYLFLDASDALAASARTELAAQFACDQPVVWRDYFSALADQLRGLTNSSAASSDLERFWKIPRFNTLRPYVVALVGAPNAGKSSLLNAIVGYERAVASPESGATRDLVGATYVYGGWEFHAVDGAGLRSTEDEIEAAGVALASDLARRADVVVQLFDPTLSKASQESMFREYLGVNTDARLNVRIPTLNKSDLPESAYAEDWRDGTKLALDEIQLQLSARDGAGIDALLRRIYTETFEADFGGRTGDGRLQPLLWRHDQTEFLQNLQALCADLRYLEALEMLTK